MADYLTIGQAAQELDVPDYVLRFWEKKFKQISPSKRRGGRRYYSKADIETIKKIKNLLHHSGYTIKGANLILNNKITKINNLQSIPQITMASPKKTIKQLPPQPDLFGDSFASEAKEKLKELLERLKQAQNLLNSQSN